MKKKPVYQISMDDQSIIQEWESVSAAAKEMNFPQPSICAAAQGKRISANGYYWCFVEDYETFKPKHRKTKEVICIETNTIYPSVKEAAAALGLNELSIRKCCGDPSGLSTYKNLHWRYVEDCQCSDDNK